MIQKQNNNCVSVLFQSHFTRAECRQLKTQVPSLRLAVHLLAGRVTPRSRAVHTRHNSSQTILPSIVRHSQTIDKPRNGIILQQQPQAMVRGIVTGKRGSTTARGVALPGFSLSVIYASWERVHWRTSGE